MAPPDVVNRSAYCDDAALSLVVRERCGNPPRCGEKRIFEAIEVATMMRGPL